MDITELWAKILLWLTEHAPTTAGALRPQPVQLDLTSVEREIDTELPAELREWWGCCGGVEGNAFAEVLPPFYTPYGPDQSLQAWRAHREGWEHRWAKPACDYYAGSAGDSYHPAWVPVAFDGCADELVVDLRPGSLHGCVLEWEEELARVERPEWAGIADMLEDVYRALTEGGSAGYSVPTVTTDGRLDWRIT